MCAPPLAVITLSPALASALATTTATTTTTTTLASALAGLAHLPNHQLEVKSAPALMGTSNEVEVLLLFVYIW